METNNQTKMNEVKLFSVFDTPDRVIVEGADITDEIIKNFGCIEKWLQFLVVACNESWVTAFMLSRIDGVVKLYVKSIYLTAGAEMIKLNYE